MSNKTLTTIYIGVTNNLERRVLEHKLGVGSDFTKRYKLDRLIYFEDGVLIQDAIAREKQLKRWHREWKWNLIKSMNPTLEDLSKGWYDDELLKNRDPECFSLTSKSAVNSYIIGFSQRSPFLAHAQKRSSG